MVKNQKGFLAIFVVVGALIMLGLIGGAFYLGTIVNSNSVVVEQSKVSPSPVMSVAPTIPTDSSLVYEDSNLGISFNYPQGWFVWVVDVAEYHTIYISAKPKESSIDEAGPEDYNLITLSVDNGSIPSSIPSSNGGVEVPVNLTQKYTNQNNYPIYAPDYLVEDYVFIYFGSDKYVSASVGGYSNQVETRNGFEKLILSIRKI